jgi:hypothetical protein
VNPTVVTAVARRPDGSELALVVQTNAGAVVIKGQTYPIGTVYMAKVDFDVAGPWTFAFTAAGSYKGYEPGVIPVRAART